MRMFSLDGRLSAISELIPYGAKLSDIGAGHGKLSISLLKAGVIESAALSDVSEKSLLRAKYLAKRHIPERNVRFDISDGLSHLGSEDCDTIVISGMGGGTIAEILKESPFSLCRHRLILQPMSSPEDLRRFLFASGLGIKEERLAADGDRLYLIIVSPGAVPETVTCADLFLGTGHEKSELFERHRDSVQRRLSEMRRGALLRGEGENYSELLRAESEIMGKRSEIL